MGERDSGLYCQICQVRFKGLLREHLNSGLHELSLLSDDFYALSTLKNIYQRTNCFKCPVCQKNFNGSNEEHFQQCGLDPTTWLPASSSSPLPPLLASHPVSRIYPTLTDDQKFPLIIRWELSPIRFLGMIPYRIFKCDQKLNLRVVQYRHPCRGSRQDPSSSSLVIGNEFISFIEILVIENSNRFISWNSFPLPSSMATKRYFVEDSGTGETLIRFLKKKYPNQIPIAVNLNTGELASLNHSFTLNTILLSEFADFKKGGFIIQLLSNLESIGEFIH